MKVKNLKALALEITKRDNNHRQFTIADCAEIISIISDLCFEDRKLLEKLFINGKRRAKKK